MSPFASTEWLRGRIRSFLRHQYQAERRVQAAGGELDEWAQPVVTHSGAELPRACLFIDEGSYIQSPVGVVQVETPTLIVEADDPLLEGDMVISVVDPETGWEFLTSPAVVEIFTDIASAGPVLMRMVGLRHAEVV